MAPGRVPEPCVLAIFGASGDLTRRKLVPAIWHLQQQSRLPESFALLGLGRRDMDDDAFRAQMRDGIREFVGEVDFVEVVVQVAGVRLEERAGDFFRVLGGQDLVAKLDQFSVEAVEGQVADLEVDVRCALLQAQPEQACKFFTVHVDPFAVVV